MQLEQEYEELVETDGKTYYGTFTMSAVKEALDTINAVDNLHRDTAVQKGLFSGDSGLEPVRMCTSCMVPSPCPTRKVMLDQQKSI